MKEQQRVTTTLYQPQHDSNKGAPGEQQTAWLRRGGATRDQQITYAFSVPTIHKTCQAVSFCRRRIFDSTGLCDQNKDPFLSR